MPDIEVSPNPVSPVPSPDSPAQADLGQQPAPQPKFDNLPEATVPEPQAPQPQDSPADIVARAEKRVRDAQDAMHRKAEEASAARNEVSVLRQQLSQILKHPAFAKVETAVGNAIADSTEVDDEIKKAWAEYQAAPNDEVAFAKLMNSTTERGARKAITEIQKLLVEKENQARVAQRNAAATQTIEALVAEAAPDVPRQLFWAMAPIAESQTPDVLTDPIERLEWQVARAVELSRDAIAPTVLRAFESLKGTQDTRNTARIIMPGGGSQPGSVAVSPAGRQPTMVEQVRARQAQMGLPYQPQR